MVASNVGVGLLSMLTCASCDAGDEKQSACLPFRNKSLCGSGREGVGLAAISGFLGFGGNRLNRS